MFRYFPFWYSDAVELYNSENLKLPDAEKQIAETLNLQTEHNQYVISDKLKLFFIPARIEFKVSGEPFKTIVEYKFWLVNPAFILFIFSLMALFVGINNWKTTSYILFGVAILSYFLTIAIQNSFIRRKIEEAICLPQFEGSAETLHNQMINMGDIDICPACGAPRTTGVSVCQNCGIKLPVKVYHNNVK